MTAVIELVTYFVPVLLIDCQNFGGKLAYFIQTCVCRKYIAGIWLSLILLSIFGSRKWFNGDTHGQAFMQRPVHPSYGRVKQNVDGCLFVWMGKLKKKSFVSWSPVRRTARSALHVMSVNATFAVAARTRKVSRRPCTCPTTGKNNVDPA